MASLIQHFAFRLRGNREQIETCKCKGSDAILFLFFFDSDFLPLSFLSLNPRWVGNELHKAIGPVLADELVRADVGFNPGVRLARAMLCTTNLILGIGWFRFADPASYFRHFVSVTVGV